MLDDGSVRRLTLTVQQARLHYSGYPIVWLDGAKLDDRRVVALVDRADGRAEGQGRVSRQGVDWSKSMAEPIVREAAQSKVA